MSDQGILERAKRAASSIELPNERYEDLLRRRDRLRRSRRVRAGVAGGVIGILVVMVLVRVADGGGTTKRPADDATPTSEPSPTLEVAVPPGAGANASGADAGRDYLVDLDTGATTPLPESIRGDGEGTGYAVSADGSEVAYLDRADDGSQQVFVAQLDGTRIRQITHDERAPRDAAWSPDGTTIAYVGGGSDVFVVDLKSGRTTRVTHESEQIDGPQFSPDGESILYSASRPGGDEVLIVPVTGGEGSRLVGGDGVSAGGASLSPDGSLLVYACNATESDASLCLANADGSNPRLLVSGRVLLNAVGASWSPDGSRIAYWVFHAWDVLVIDVATGETTLVAKGAFPEWVDDHTLIVEPYFGPR